VQKRFNPDEITATKISLGRLDKLGRHRFSQIIRDERSNKFSRKGAENAEMNDFSINVDPS